MITFRELKEMFESYTQTDGEVDNVQLALWFNEAAVDLAYDLGPVERHEIAEQVMEPGNDWLRVVACDAEYVKRPDGVFLFEEEGGYIYYRVMPKLYLGIADDEDCGLSSALRNLPALFAAARYWDTESQGDVADSNQAGRWLNYYYQGKALALTRLEEARLEMESWLVR